MRNARSAQSRPLRKKVVTIGIVCLFLITIFTVIFGKKGVMDIHQAKKELAGLEAELSRLQSEKNRLMKEIERLEKDPRAVEKQAREKLGLVAPGEKVIIIPSQPVK